MRRNVFFTKVPMGKNRFEGVIFVSDFDTREET
jgi:hypothetical protein